MASSRGIIDKAPIEGLVCQIEGCNRKLKATIGAMRRNPTLRCSAGHKNVMNARELDKEVRKFEKRWDKGFGQPEHASPPRGKADRINLSQADRR